MVSSHSHVCNLKFAVAMVTDVQTLSETLKAFTCIVSYLLSHFSEVESVRPGFFLNRSPRRKTGMATNPLFITPDCFAFSQ